ncbi:MAG: hypothetical protein KF745_09935 [Phycisphaeraceae bacterium]|nr:hypothetical protein [Phycisphaeraceae bacterium]
MSDAPIIVILSTHTPRHLRRTLLGVASQSRRPDGVVVSCDTDERELLETIGAASSEFGVPIVRVWRPFTGRGRSSQVRNNGVRAALARWPELPDEARLVLLDGDCCPASDAVLLHASLAKRRRADLVIGYRVDLTPEQTDGFDEARLRQGLLPVEVTAAQGGMLARRQRRYAREQWLRRFGLGKAHKPKLLSANFSVSLGAYRMLNGFDEGYEDYGQEDDDFGRRFHRSGGRAAVGVDRIIVLHLYHPTRAPGRWHEAPNAERFRRGGPVSCELGLSRPAAQGALRVELLEPGMAAVDLAAGKPGPQAAEQAAASPASR